MDTHGCSVVVPTFDRPARILECVTALASLQPPAGGFEIVVVNDGGIEPSDAVRAAAAAGNASSVQFLTQRNRGAAAARNHGTSKAGGRWLAFTDDDCVPEHDWLLVLEQALAAKPDALVGGAVVNALDTNLFSETSQILVEFVAGWFDARGQRERFFTSNNIAVARDAFLSAGGFDERFGTGAAEDREFCDRWYAQGRPSMFERHAVVHHAHVLTATSFLRQHLGYGMGARTFRAIRRDQGRPVRIDPAFYVGSIRHALRRRPRARGAALAALTLVAHAAYLAGVAATRPGGLRAASQDPDPR